jgi:hypothetical protein
MQIFLQLFLKKVHYFAKKSENGRNFEKNRLKNDTNPPSPNGKRILSRSSNPKQSFLPGLFR